VTLQARAGIVEHGYFLGIASEVIVAGEEGIRRLRRASE
jgi:ribose 5-phosphate isomerase A